MAHSCPGACPFLTSRPRWSRPSWACWRITSHAAPAQSRMRCASIGSGCATRSSLCGTVAASPWSAPTRPHTAGGAAGNPLPSGGSPRAADGSTSAIPRRPHLHAAPTRHHGRGRARCRGAPDSPMAQEAAAGPARAGDGRAPLPPGPAPRQGADAGRGVGWRPTMPARPPRLRADGHLGGPGYGNARRFRCAQISAAHAPRGAAAASTAARTAWSNQASRAADRAAGADARRAGAGGVVPGAGDGQGKNARPDLDDRCRPPRAGV